MGRFSRFMPLVKAIVVIANTLMAQGIDTSKSSVERLIKGKGIYRCRVVPEQVQS